MSLITANNIGVLSGTIFMPLTGVWSADLVLDQPDGTGFSAGTQVTIASESFSLVGTVAPNRTGDFLDAVHVRILGGAAGMATLATPRAFTQPGAFARDVVSSLLANAGETLSGTADPALLGTNLTAWAITQVPVSQSLVALLNLISPASNWRFLADGTLWIGSESWPSNSGTFDILHANPSEGTFELGVESPFVMPGDSLPNVGNVNRVEHEILSKSVRSHIKVDMGSTDRGLVAGIQGIVKQAIAGIDYYALYSAKVVSQSGSTVDVQPTSSRLPPMGRVALRFGLPGVSFTVIPGTTVLVGWDGADPASPYACLWDGSETVSQLALAALQVAIGQNASLNVLTSFDWQNIILALTSAAAVPMDGGTTLKATFLAALSAFATPGSQTVKVSA